MSAASFPKVMVTGHRTKALTPAQQEWGKRELYRTLKRLQQHHGAQEAITGMALGADTWWAQAALKLDMPFSAYIPFEVQPLAWSPAEQERWRQLRSRAVREVVLGDSYHVRFFHARNDAMIRDCDLAVALLRSDSTSGGTFSAVKKLRSLKRPLLLLDPLTENVSKEFFPS